MSVQESLHLRKHPCYKCTADNNGVQYVPEVPAVAARVEHNPEVKDLPRIVFMIDPV